MELEEFCMQLEHAVLPNVQKALAILWFYDCQSPGIRVTPGKLAQTIRKAGLGHPNSTQLSNPNFSHHQ